MKRSVATHNAARLRLTSHGESAVRVLAGLLLGWSCSAGNSSGLNGGNDASKPGGEPVLVPDTEHTRDSGRAGSMDLGASSKDADVSDGPANMDVASAKDGGGSGTDRSSDGGITTLPCGSPCVDAIDCTKDECLNGVCAHKIDSSVCAAGEACDPGGLGCTTTSPCGGNPDCADSDPCTRNERCNTSVASCEWDVLDGDSDGYPATACGGADSNDANPDIYPGSPEICDGVDNDVDGTVDEEPAGSDSCGGATCSGGKCPGCTSLRDRAGLDRSYLWNTSPTTVWGVASSCVATASTPATEKTCFNDRVDEYLSSQCRQCFNPYLGSYAACCIVFPPTNCNSCLCASDGPVNDFEACSGVASSECK